MIDHRIVDLDGHDVGRVDDLWVCISDGRGTIGPIISGAAALLRQFGGAGNLLLRIAPHIGYHHATRWREFGWDDVAALQRPQVILTPRLADLAARPESHASPAAGQELVYTTLIRLPVRDPNGHTVGVVDIRTTLPESEPEILGFLVMTHPLRHTVGMKRFDSTSQRFAGTHPNTRYLPWEDVEAIDVTGIRTRVPIGDLPMLRDTPASQPPPMPNQADQP